MRYLPHVTPQGLRDPMLFYGIRCFSMFFGLGVTSSVTEAAAADGWRINAAPKTLVVLT
jgi:hypothetical protein